MTTIPTDPEILKNLIKKANIKNNTNNKFTADDNVPDLKFNCVICKEESSGYGNNPRPLCKNGKCCDACNIKVIMCRIKY